MSALAPGSQTGVPRVMASAASLPSQPPHSTLSLPSSVMNARNLAVYGGGILFGFGLAYSGMTQPEIVLSFLRLEDLGLIFVMGGAAVVTFFAIYAVPKFMKAPVLGGTFKPRISVLTRNTIIGAAIFGIGWGISGQCPGSAVASLGTGNWPIAVGIAFIRPVPRLGSCKPRHGKLAHRGWHRVHVPWRLPKGKVRQR